MVTPPKKKPRHFWASASAVKVIRDALGNPDWKPTSGQEAWETLRDEIVALNSKGRFKPFDAPKQVVNGREIYLHLEGQPLPEKEDWVAMKPELCRRLAIVAKLLQLLQRRLLTSLAKHKGLSPQKLAGRLRDPRTRTFFDLAFSIGSVDTPMGMNALEKVGREGVTWTLPGGIEQGYRDRDCGFEPIVLATRQALRLLGKKNKVVATHLSDRRNQDKLAMISNQHRLPFKKRKIRVSMLTGMIFKLKAKNCQSITIRGKYGILFYLLYNAYQSKEKQHGGLVSYATCIDYIWPVTESRDDEDLKCKTRKRPKHLETTVAGKAPEVLKKLKSELELQLRNAFDDASVDHELCWIETRSGEGYQLNQNVVVWYRSRKITSSHKVEPEH